MTKLNLAFVDGTHGSVTCASVDEAIRALTINQPAIKAFSFDASQPTTQGNITLEADLNDGTETSASFTHWPQVAEWITTHAPYLVSLLVEVDAEASSIPDLETVTPV